MSLLMLKTKNLSWQDHTLNIEVMLAPLRSTLLLNKHKTLDTKFDKEKALYERQREACIKDFVVEKRMIERRKQKLLKRKKELMEARAQSALDDAQDTLPPASNKERSTSAPTDSRGRATQQRDDASQGDGMFHVPTPGLPKLTLRHTPLFGASNFLRPRMFLETGNGGANQSMLSDSDGGSPMEGRSKRGSISVPEIVLPADMDKKFRKPPLPAAARRSTSKTGKTPTSGKVPEKSLKPPLRDESITSTYPRKIPSVKFLEFLNSEEDEDVETNIVVEVKEKTVEEKVRDFLKELESFNSRPPTSCSGALHDDILLSMRSRDTERRAAQAANKYTTLTLDKKLLEKAFDRYLEKKSHEDLLKAMKLAAKMKAHIRQARNTSLVPTMATFKSSRSFMRILKRQQRKEQHGGGHSD